MNNNLAFKNRVYLGDSVYAYKEGMSLVLITDNGYPDDPRNKIYLDVPVLDALLEYINKPLKEACDDSNI